MNIVYVFIGGGLGSLLRYGIGQLLSKTGLQLPLGTLVANISACVIFALGLAYFSDRLATQPHLKWFILTGVCGGLSTFSTFSAETFELFRQGQNLWALVNIGLNIVLCLIIFYVWAKPESL